MGCAWVRERVLPYASGELAEPDERRVRAHLRRCVRCAALLAELERTEAALGPALHAHAEPPAELDARVLAAIRAWPTRRTEPVRAWPAARRAWPALALALLAVTFVVGRVSVSAPATYPAQRGLALAREAHASAELGQAAPPPADLAPEGARLLAAGRITMGGVPLVVARYDVGGKVVTLVQGAADGLGIPARRSGVEEYAATREAGLSYVTWRANGQGNVMVSRDVPMHVVFHLACRACEQQDRSAPRQPES